MKNYEEFRLAMETDSKVLEEAKKVITEGMTEAEKTVALVEIAKKFGYGVTVEDFSVDEAVNGEISDDEVKLAVGGTQPRACFLDYGCSLIWNTCVCSNECSDCRVCNDLMCSPR